LIDEIEANFAQFSVQIDALEEGINSNFLQQSENASLLQIAQAIELSSQVWLKLKNANAQSQASKALALDDARSGLSNTVNAVKSLVETQNTDLTPQAVQEIYSSLAFALSIQINVAATWSLGEKTDTGYSHGGFLPFKGEIEAGLDLLKTAEATLKSKYIEFVPEVFNSKLSVEVTKFDGTTGTYFNFFRKVSHDFPTDEMALEFFEGLRGNATFNDIAFDIELNDGFVRLIFPIDFQESGARVGLDITPAFREMNTDWNLAINESLEDYLFFYLTGLKTEPPEVLGVEISYPWYEYSLSKPTGFDALIAELEKSVDGITAVNDGIGVGQLDGTEGGDFLRGGDNLDVMRGFGGDDYLVGEDGDDDMFGMEGNDRYFGGPGNDFISDAGSADDFDVAIFEGSFTDYNFYEVGTAIAIVKVDFVLGENGTVRVVEVDTLSGIEAVKFDRSVTLVENLPLIGAPEVPVIVAISDDTGIVGDQYTSDGKLEFFGTAQANTTIEMFVRDASSNDDSIGGGVKVGLTVSDDNGDWSFDYTGTLLPEGRNTIRAEAINDAGVSSDKSQFFLETLYTVDKTGPTVEYAILSSSNEEPTLVFAGDTVTLDFEASERLLFDLGDPDSPGFSGIPGIPGGPIVPIMPIVTIGGLVAQVVENNIFFGQQNTYQATVTLDASVLLGEPLEFLIEMIDQAGNPGSADTLKDRDGSIPGLFSVGGTPTVAAPDFTVISDDTGVSATDRITSDGALLISGTADAGSTVELFLGGSSLGSVTATTGGAWSFDNTETDLAEGSYTLGANATDAGGAVSGTKRASLVIDKTAPVVESASLSSTNSIGSVAVFGDVITLTFSLDNEIKGLPVVTIAGASAVVVDLKRGDYRATVTLDEPAPQGAVTFQISATDSAGNVGSANAVTDGTSVSVNVSPVLTDLPGTVTVREDLTSDLDLSALTLSDADLTDELTVVLSASAGTLAAVDGTGVVVTGTGTAALTLVGTAAAIDTYLNTASAVQYTGAQDAAGTAAATLTLNGDDGSGEVTFGTVNIDITNVNDAPTGSVTINGTPIQGGVLSAASTLADIDGIGTLSYQWQRGDTEITGATAATYTLGQADVGAAISVRVSYTDAQDTAEAVTSTPTAAVTNVNDAPTGGVLISGTAAEDAILTAVSTLADEDGIGTLSYQWQRGDTEITGATAATYTLGQADVGAAISVRVSYTDQGGTNEAVSSAQTALVIGTANTAATGSLVVNGFKDEGAELTVTSSLADDDDLGTLAYQWLRDGTAISGETRVTYTLGEDDVGARISVSASYTDGRGNAAQVLSPRTTAISERVDLRGTPEADKLNGTPAPERIEGLADNDVITGGGASDQIFGRNGDDYIFGDKAAALYYGSAAANQVFRLYQATFDREPDSVGHAAWAGRIATGEQTLQQVTQGFVGSQEFLNTFPAGTSAEVFVRALYENVLGTTTPDAQGLARWTAAAENNRADAVIGLMESPQFIGETTNAANGYAFRSLATTWSDDVFRLYQATLDRAPDVQGQTNWAERLASGERTLVEVAEGFVGSPEFTAAFPADASNDAFVRLLYDNVLGTTPDAQGLARWTGELEGGATRAQVVLGFSQSPQFTAETAADLKAWMLDLGVDDRIDGGPGTNVLTGGQFADVFVFNRSDASTNTVVDLEAWDGMKFIGFGYGNEAAVIAEMSQRGGSVVFDDQGVLVTFLNTQLGQITDDMILV
jgi:cytochrome c5